MTISYNWLKEYISITETPEELGHLLTGTGLEVESIEKFETIKGGLEGIVIGKVLTCGKHPNADKLSITTVDVGRETPLDIVCGASNVAAGQKVVVATPGCTLYPFNGEPFQIKSAKIRGEKSEGMICAEDEIGLGQSHDGIMVLETDLPNGTPASEYFKIETDYIFEIGLTPNRADAMSHIGVARDIRAVTGRDIRWPSNAAFKIDNTNKNIQVTVENEAACPRYSSLTISNVTVAESPSWLKNRLLSIGLTPINNIVDITNFVNHEMGQPLHAFNADAIDGGKVIVKTLPAGTKFKTLDEKERTLTSNDLMICNATEGMCIAGVFGGIGSGITESTNTIFLESANFSAEYIRKTAMHHQLKTDASFRFERGTDPLITVTALKRAAILIKEIAGGEISSEITDLFPSPIGNRELVVKDKNVNRLIGKAIDRATVFSILEALDISIINKTETEFTVSVPPYRVDVLQEADVIEEVLRIYGFNNIELAAYAGSDYLAEFPEKDIDKFKRSISEMLVANGFYEIITNSLTNLAYQQKHNLTFKGEPVEMLNKLSEEQGILRQTMLFTGLEAAAHNINRKQKDLKLFEFGKVYDKMEGKYAEEGRLALYMTGNNEAENWRNPSKPVTYHDLAQETVHILQRSGLFGLKEESLENHPLLAYGIRVLSGQKEIGILGKVKSNLLKDFGIKQDLFYADFSTAILFKKSNPKVVAEEVSKFPEVRRDLSLVLDRKISFAEIQALVMQTEKRLIKKITAFDVYEGKNIPEGKKAYALAITLADDKKTLTDKEIEKTMTRLMTAFEQTLGAVIRK